jgi:AcrR family transcriptional regulator
MEPARADQRRAAGERTRARLMEAALDLIAERGEGGLTLRELTDAAEANVAAVSYHFGGLNRCATRPRRPRSSAIWTLNRPR